MEDREFVILFLHVGSKPPHPSAGVDLFTGPLGHESKHSLADFIASGETKAKETHLHLDPGKLAPKSILFCPFD
jgi:hypothetical protein